MRRVVVTTPPGMVCGLGDSSQEVFSNMLLRKRPFANVNPETHFDPAAVDKVIDPETLVCAYPGTDEMLLSALGDQGEKWMDRHELFALLAAAEPMVFLMMSGVLDTIDLDRFGTSMATGDGGLAEMHTAELRIADGKRLMPTTSFAQLPNIHSSIVARMYGLRGPNFVDCTACSASAKAIINAGNAIKTSMADMMLVGGAEAAITPFGLGAFHTIRALGQGRPYHQDKDGFVMGEGASMFVLEALDHALERGAPIYAELLGYGASCDADPSVNLAVPKAEGGARAAKAALAMAGLDASAIQYLNTHGTGTPSGDAPEIEGIAQWAGDHLVNIALSSTKSGTGHLLGGASALEAAVCLKVIETGIIPPTSGVERDTFDNECDGPFHVIGAPLERKVDVAMSNSFGFGGTNASVIFGRYYEE